MVFCTYCGHSFTRDEHLERHILTHTNVKPFKCFTCHMSFARRDLLQRHYTVHGRTQDQQQVPAIDGMVPKSAGRTPIACLECSKSKTKCDKKFPCSRCSARNLTCTLRPTRRSTKNAARLGLITAETLAQGLVEGELPPDQTITARTVAMPPDSANVAIMTGHTSTIAFSNNAQRSRSCSDDGSVSSDDQHAQDASTQSPDTQKIDSETPPTATSSPPTPLSGTEFPDPTYIATSWESDSRFSKPNSAKNSPASFNLDWQGMPVGMDIDPTISPTTTSPHDNLNFNFNGLDLASHMDPMLAMTIDYTPAVMSPLNTSTGPSSIDSTYFGQNLLDGVIFDAHGRHLSFDSINSMDCLDDSMGLPTHFGDPIVAARNGWNVFKCVPRVHPNLCPKTARWNLESLEHTLQTPKIWHNWQPPKENAIKEASAKISVMQLHESSRDKLLAITQSFLHKAMEMHRGANEVVTKPGFPAGNFLLLPPTRVLEHLLGLYTDSFERYFPVTSRGSLDANELMHCFNDKASSLLILLMLAQGARSISMPEARSLTVGLIEACRISLFDMIERNIVMASDHHVLHAALIFVELGSWSGDKWQMDIAKGQRGIYTAMLRHSGMLALTHASETPQEMVAQDVLSRWNAWVQLETRSRLVHSWAMVDQEVALFHDSTPSFSVTEFTLTIPQADKLWHAKTADEWASLQKDPDQTLAEPYCLKDLFRSFLDDEMEPLVGPLSLRLLLHPLQIMVSHYTQLMSCFSDSGSSRAKNKTVTASSTRCRLEEVQCLLQRWHSLATTYLETESLCPIMQNSLVLFHIICLNIVTDFPLIERLARREAFDGTYQSLVWTHRKCISDIGEALFHCGQVIRVILAMAKDVRPSWWAAAIYRVALVLWCDSLINKDNNHGNNKSSTQQSGGSNNKANQTVAIDTLAHDHPLMVRYLNRGEGVPVLTKPDGTLVTLDHGVSVLGHCISIIDAGTPTLLNEGIKSKLEQLMAI